MDDRRIEISRAMIDAYDDYTHVTLDRRGFMRTLRRLAGSTAAAAAIVPLLEANAAAAAIVEPDDPRLEAGRLRYPGEAGGMRGYLAIPKAADTKLPGVLVIHENRGLNPHIEDVARRMALEGFIVLAPDFLSGRGGTPADEDVARGMFRDLEHVTENALASLRHLAADPRCTGRIGATGFCWGGGTVGALAVAAGDELAAAVPWYGRQPDPAEVPRIRARVLAHYAGNDERINAGIPAFREALEAAGIDHRIHVYEGVAHAFHNDTAAARYDKPAATLAWQRTVAFLKETLA